MPSRFHPEDCSKNSFFAGNVASWETHLTEDELRKEIQAPQVSDRKELLALTVAVDFCKMHLDVQLGAGTVSRSQTELGTLRTTRSLVWKRVKTTEM